MQDVVTQPRTIRWNEPSVIRGAIGVSVLIALGLILAQFIPVRASSPSSPSAPNYYAAAGWSIGDAGWLIGDLEDDYGLTPDVADCVGRRIIASEKVRWEALGTAGQVAAVDYATTNYC